jgi:RNA-splicing ligase RtcB
MKDYEDEAFDELEKAQQRKVAHGVTDGSKVTIDRAKLEQVLEALEELFDTNGYWWQEVDEQTLKKIEHSITAIKEALEDV